MRLVTGCFVQHPAQSSVQRWLSVRWRVRLEARELPVFVDPRGQPGGQ